MENKEHNFKKTKKSRKMEKKSIKHNRPVCREKNEDEDLDERGSRLKCEAPVEVSRVSLRTRAFLRRGFL